MILFIVISRYVYVIRRYIKWMFVSHYIIVVISKHCCKEPVLDVCNYVNIFGHAVKKAK